MSMEPAATTNPTHHREHLADRAAMLVMRTVIALHAKADLEAAGRPAFDELMEKIPSAERVTYEAATVGGVPGWWCRPVISRHEPGFANFRSTLFEMEEPNDQDPVRRPKA